MSSILKKKYLLLLLWLFFGYGMAKDSNYSEAVAILPVSQLQEVDPLWHAYNCLGELEKYHKDGPSAVHRAVVSAEKLLTLQSQDAMGRSGWPYVRFKTAASDKCGVIGSIDAFGDGSCNPPDTPYMIQTGYAMACLANVGRLATIPRFVAAARKAATDSWELGVDGSPCAGGFEYWYSYHPNDHGRFVRNINAVMGMGLIAVYEATGESQFRDRAKSIARAEHCELQAGNFGYFGVMDPKYKNSPAKEARRIENHILHQVKFLQLAEGKLKIQESGKDAQILLNEFLTCTEPQCKPDNCQVWGVGAGCRVTQSIAACMAEEDDRRWQAACSEARSKFSNFTGWQLFLMRRTHAEP